MWVVAQNSSLRFMADALGASYRRPVIATRRRQAFLGVALLAAQFAHSGASLGAHTITYRPMPKSAAARDFQDAQFQWEAIENVDVCGSSGPVDLARFDLQKMRSAAGVDVEKVNKEIGVLENYSDLTHNDLTNREVEEAHVDFSQLKAYFGVRLAAAAYSDASLKYFTAAREAWSQQPRSAIHGVNQKELLVAIAALRKMVQIDPGSGPFITSSILDLEDLQHATVKEVERTEPFASQQLIEVEMLTNEVFESSHPVLGQNQNWCP